MSRYVDHIGQNVYIKPTYLVSVPEFSGARGGRSQLQIATEQNLRENQHKGELSKKSQKKLRNAVNWLIESSKAKYLWSKKHNKAFYFKVNFITLTFPYEQDNAISERQCKQAVHNWLSYARRYMYLRNYVWKCEKTIAGQLHIHLTTDTFIKYTTLRKSWNRILLAQGLLDHYSRKHGNVNPNSTDVHAVKSVRNLSAYISKYMAKSESKLGEFKGRIWGCNREISEANSCRVFVDRHSLAHEMKVLYSSKVEFKPIMSKPDSLGNTKQIAELFFIQEANWQQLQKSIIKKAYDDRRFLIRNNIQEMPEEYWSSFVDELLTNTNNHGNTSGNNQQSRTANERVHPKDERRKRPKRTGNTSQLESLFTGIEGY